ncbi:hypothetical protein Dimus_032291 [Dionaea muscipula]
MVVPSEQRGWSPSEKCGGEDDRARERDDGRAVQCPVGAERATEGRDDDHAADCALGRASRRLVQEWWPPNQAMVRVSTADQCLENEDAKQRMVMVVRRASNRWWWPLE